MPSDIDMKAEHRRMSVSLLIQPITYPTIPKCQPLALLYPFWTALAKDPLRLPSQSQLTAPFQPRSLLPLPASPLSTYALPSARALAHWRRGNSRVFSADARDNAYLILSPEPTRE
jgi:hypothetical protein